MKASILLLQRQWCTWHNHSPNCLSSHSVFRRTIQKLTRLLLRGSNYNHLYNCATETEIAQPLPQINIWRWNQLVVKRNEMHGPGLVRSSKWTLRWSGTFPWLLAHTRHLRTRPPARPPTRSPHIKCFNHKTQQSVLWQTRQVILSGEECHCNPLMLLSHPQRVWVSLPALIYTDRSWRKSSFCVSEGERDSVLCSSRRCIKALTMLLQCQPHNDVLLVSHSICDVLPLLSVSLTSSWLWLSVLTFVGTVVPFPSFLPPPFPPFLSIIPSHFFPISLPSPYSQHAVS